MITKKEIIEYFGKWGGQKENFVSMLMKKAYYAGQNNEEVFANGKMRNAKELNEMLCIADDL